MQCILEEIVRLHVLFLTCKYVVARYCTWKGFWLAWGREVLAFIMYIYHITEVLPSKNSALISHKRTVYGGCIYAQ